MNTLVRQGDLVCCVDPGEYSRSANPEHRLQQGRIYTVGRVYSGEFYARELGVGLLEVPMSMVVDPGGLGGFALSRFVVVSADRRAQVQALFARGFPAAGTLQ